MGLEGEGRAMEGGGGGGSGGGGMVCKVVFGNGDGNSAIATAARWVAKEVCLAAPPDVFKRFFFTAEHARLMRGAVGGSRVTANPSIYPVDTLFELFVPHFADDDGDGGGGGVGDGGVFRTITKRQIRISTPPVHLNPSVSSSSTGERSTHSCVSISVIALRRA